MPLSRLEERETKSHLDSTSHYFDFRPALTLNRLSELKYDYLASVPEIRQTTIITYHQRRAEFTLAHWMYCQCFLPVVVAALGFGILSLLQTTQQTCRCRPWEQCWPSEAIWKSFNASIDGNLARVKPVGYVCHEPTFDQAACEETILLASDSGWRASQPGITHSFLCFHPAA